MQVVQLLFDAVDGLDEIVLIADGKRHAGDSNLYGNQRLMYCGLLLPIHEPKFEPVCGAPQVPQTDGPRPRLRTGPLFVAKSAAYLAGAESALEEVDELVLDDFL
jgi:hypothetical protein